MYLERMKGRRWGAAMAALLLSIGTGVGVSASPTLPDDVHERGELPDRFTVRALNEDQYEPVRQEVNKLQAQGCGIESEVPSLLMIEVLCDTSGRQSAMAHFLGKPDMVIAVESVLEGGG